METIKNYLETMFAKLPNTLEVQKAKRELWQMMEDKYTELINEGRTENEAVGTVISEFGNLDELSADLGIKDAVSWEDFEKLRRVTLDEVKEYFRDRAHTGYMIALGVFLCITCWCGFLVDISNWRYNGAIGLTYLFLSLSVAVGLFVFSGLSGGKWDFIKKQPCSISFETADYVHNQLENFRVTKALMITLGVMLCIFSVVPVSVLSDFSRFENLGVIVMFALIGIGVFLFVVAGVRASGFETILALNRRATVERGFEPLKIEKEYANKTVEAIMSVYWQSVTCIYLCWSFISFDWHITWIVWVIAAVCKNLIDCLYEKKE